MTTEICKHLPKPNPGMRCDCLECRKARIKVFEMICHQCVVCSGRCAIDRNGNVACEKGEPNCPILDLWWSTLNRVTDPNRTNSAKVELIFKGVIEPPQRYPRTTAIDYDLGAIPGGLLVAPPGTEEEAPELENQSRPVLTAEENAPVTTEPKKKRGKRA